MTAKYLNPSNESATKLFSKPIQGEVVMLNLLRFKEHADYSNCPELAPKNAVSGKQAYQTYIEQTLPLLRESGGEVIFLGSCDAFFIGPEHEKWDLIMLIKQNSLADFMAFASDPQYMKILGHRQAAIDDSRLLPAKGIDSLV